MRIRQIFRRQNLSRLAKFILCGILCMLCAVFAPSAWCQLDVPLANYDQQRSGGYTGEVSLNPGNVGDPNLFGFVGSYQGIDNCIYAHPLYVHNVMIFGQAQPLNAIFILTTNGSIYVFNADRPFNLLDSITGFGQFANNPGNGDVRNCPDNGQTGPTGVMGTPVIDRANNWLWYVINRDGSGNQTGPKQYILVAYNYSTHLNDMVIDVTASGFDPGQQTQRTGMLYNYATPPYFSFGFSSTRSDQSPWQGWVFTYTYNCDASGSNCALQQSNAVNLSPNGDGAGVWMSGGGIAWDGSYQYFNTGNGLAIPGDYPNYIGQLTVPGFFVNAFPAPGGQDNDADLASGRAIAVPGMNIVLAAGKAGNLYILNTPSLSLAAAVQPVCPDTSQNGALFAGFAEWNRDVYVWCARDYLKKFHLSDLLSNQLIQLFPAQETAGNDAGGNIGVSGTGGWNQADGTNGIVWATYGTVDRFGPGIFAAHDADTGVLLFQTSLSAWQKFTPPVVANGRAYVATADGQVLIYGLFSQ